MQHGKNHQNRGNGEQGDSAVVEERGFLRNQQNQGEHATQAEQTREVGEVEIGQHGLAIVLAGTEPQR